MAHKHLEEAAGRGSVQRALVVLRRVLIVLAALVAAALVWWAAGSYQADGVALAALADADGAADGVVVQRLGDGSVAFVPKDTIEGRSVGFVFYPGARVDPEAYAALLTKCARRGVTCVLVRPPLDFALCAIGVADAVRNELPEVDLWLVGGHSLGGVAACEYLAGHSAEVAGLVLLASYPNVDLTGYTGAVLSMVGDNDGVVDKATFENKHDLLPPQTADVVVEGGNHAQFGDYGKQEGDGVATISRERQQDMVADALAGLVSGLAP